MNNTNQIFTFVLSLAVIFCVSCSSSSENQDIQAQQTFEVELETVRAGYNPDTLWAQAYIAATPPPRQELFVTLNQYITGKLFYYLNERTEDPE